MGQQVPIRAVVRLPDSTEVGFPVAPSAGPAVPGTPSSLTGGSRHRQRKTADDHGGHDRDQRLSEDDSAWAAPFETPRTRCDVRQPGRPAVRAPDRRCTLTKPEAAMSSRGREFGCIMDALEAALLPEP